MSPKRISNILSILEIAENNIKSAKSMLYQMVEDKGWKEAVATSKQKTVVNSDEAGALEVVEGYFDGENVLGDNGQLYPVPQNYASKTQLVIGDRMKRILTKDRELFKLIKPAERETITGQFAIEGDDFYVLADGYPDPIRILKASATFAIKNLGLEAGDDVVVVIPKDHTPSWGAFSSVVKSDKNKSQDKTEQTQQALDDDLKEFEIDKKEVEEEIKKLDDSADIEVDTDYF